MKNKITLFSMIVGLLFLGKSSIAQVVTQPHCYSYSNASASYNFIIADNVDNKNLVKLWINRRLNVNAKIYMREYDKTANSVHFVALGTNGFTRAVVDVWVKKVNWYGFLNYKVYVNLNKPDDLTGLRGSIMANGVISNWQMFYTDLWFPK